MTDAGLKRVLVVDDDASILQLLRLILSNEGYEVISSSNGQDAYEKAVRQIPDLAILDVMVPGMDGYALCRKLRENRDTRAVPIIMLTAHGDVADRIKGFEAGADDFLIKPFEPKELTYRVRNLLARAQTVPQAQGKGRPRGRIISIFGAKGGVGKTTIAVNLAIALKRKTNKRIVLIDADLSFGDIGVQLNLPIVRSVLDLANRAEDIDADLLEQVLVQHSSGIRVLLSPYNRERGELVTADHIRKILDVLSEQYDFVLVDNHSTYEERTLLALEHADVTLVVVTPEIGPLMNTSYFMEIAEKLGLDLNKVQVLLNRSNSNVGIEAIEIERSLHQRIDFRIQTGGIPVVQSVNKGNPIVLAQPNHPFSLQIAQIAETLLKKLS
ncbi:MAG: response regulator [Chloroflexi bacterium]|nr:response regulator [Chloroflexota bacterium]